MNHNVHLALVLHNHQPVGNFDHVFEQAYQDSYLPFLDVFEPYESLSIALHTSGPLMEWFDRWHPEYLDRLAALVRAGRLEIVGGAFYEPILTMTPSRDRVGQIKSYTKWLENRLGADVQGMWIAERVWEQSLTQDIAQAGIRYTILDDYHFKSTGLTEESLYGYYLTEDEGNLLAVFPGSEKLRYLIPFQEPEESIAFLGRVAQAHPGSVVVFGDDGEKFGTWPETKEHVYGRGWLRRLFDLLAANQHWINVQTPAQIMQSVAPLGKVFIPQASYREMTEWAMPAARINQYEDLRHDLETDPRWSQINQYMRTGFWRNFKVKYPESNEMYTRMLMVSRKLADAEAAGHTGKLLEEARSELYRGQCNCCYWHGAFGGIYLPHLRNAVYEHLIRADNLLDQLLRRESTWVEAIAEDYNLDGRREVLLNNERLAVLVAPTSGGQLYELDVRSICHNLQATLARRPEAYHKKVLNGPSADDADVTSIHDRVVFKQEGLDKMLQYDSYQRNSLIDHFYDDDAQIAAVARGESMERGDFVHGPFEAKILRSDGKAQVQLTRTGNAWGIPITITKGVSLAAGSSTLEIAYMLEGLPQDRTLHFAVELGFAGLPSGADDRYYYDVTGNRLGQLGEMLNLTDVEGVGLVDEWLGIDLGLSVARPANIWTYPIQSVSQSEGGFEAVHQSLVVMPHWHVQGDAEGRWSVTMNLSIDCAMAEARRQETAAASAS